VSARAVELYAPGYLVRVSLSRRRAVVWRGRARVQSFTVAVGRPANPTPTGRFTVTDKLSIRGPSAYGCCAVALSGHQPQVPQGWGGGDRLAIHGTADPSSIGRAASLGCLRARPDDLHRLLDTLPLGTPVEIGA
jgi:lipoprotein-anchoring transpeptidase ErfK/SrfK